MQKIKQLLFTAEDETNFTRELKSVLPDLMFIDDCLWEADPQARHSISDCSSGFSYLFNKRIDELPTLTRSNGLIAGPTSGCVIQFIRSKLENGVLRSGSISTGFEKSDIGMADFTKTVMKCLKKCGSVGVKDLHGNTNTHYILGHAAKRDWNNKKITLRDRSVPVLFVPK